MLDETAGREPLRIEGYASLFGFADLNRDVVEAGAFQRALRLRGARGVRMLFQHDAGEPVGVWDEIREDAKGLFVRGRVLAAGPRGKATAALIREGAVDGLSIGFRTEQFTSRPSGGRYLKQIDLWEVSIVTFPMLPQARLRQAQLVSG
ncbi:HK97 family phage prohead protease [Hyphobacterium sp. HN65]|uniref:HK97 family phage prohead protease n=1 Tax=Hyphobacterium lacteum TaxID=3116575 RepID=A0ABU7LT67_9PROT|nr:HK97 family phage prohead protease [Hyphobacterium sp. HN65]MEE2527055.1 HK97 family phage prohead protease [Hyphobacterium sp. HN65]